MVRSIAALLEAYLAVEFQNRCMSSVPSVLET
jgi:hypothetical protein